MTRLSVWKGYLSILFFLFFKKKNSYNKITCIEFHYEVECSLLISSDTMALALGLREMNVLFLCLKP